MSCCGQHRALAASGKLDFPVGNENHKSPLERCVFCAEKHLSYASRLAAEWGYETPNRQIIIGEMVAAQNHLCADHPMLAEKIRDARHRIQRRRESEVDWHPLLTEIDRLAAAEAKRILEESNQPTKKES